MAALGLTALGFGVLAGGASAQTVDGGSTSSSGSADLASQFGGYELSARGNGVLLTYDIENALPVSPVVSLGLPEALATQTNSAGYALASLAYPGPLVADFGSALKQGGTDAPIPPYPVRTQAFHPGEQTEQRQSTFPGADMASVTDETSSQASSKYSGFEVPAALDVGTVEVTSRTELVQGQVVARSRVAQSDVNLLSGLIRIESVVTDIVSTSNGEAAATDGTTTVNGVTVLGLEATIDADGVRLAERLPDPSALDQVTKPVVDGLGQVAGPVAGGAEPLTQQLSDLISRTLGGQKTLNDLLLASGIQVRVLQPAATVEAGAASINAAGLGISFVYPGASDERLAQLLALLPSDQLPSEGIPGAGVSPQSTVNLFKETHIADVSIAPASAAVNATPAFAFDEGELGSSGSLDGGAFGTGAFDTGSLGTGGGGFDTAVPSLPGSGALASGFGAAGNAIPLALVLITIFTAPFWAAASRRFAEASLGATSAACPVGKDNPSPPPGSA